MAERARNRQGCGQATTARKHCRLSAKWRESGSGWPALDWMRDEGSPSAQMEQPQLQAIRKVVPSLRTHGWQGGMESAGVALPAIAGLHCGGQPVGHLVDSSSEEHVVVLSGEEIRSADFERSGLSELGLLADEHQAELGLLADEH
jgi:hypothetical protein